jgi:hypothetical protein
MLPLDAVEPDRVLEESVHKTRIYPFHADLFRNRVLYLHMQNFPGGRVQI